MKQVNFIVFLHDDDCIHSGYELVTYSDTSTSYQGRNQLDLHHFRGWMIMTMTGKGGNSFPIYIQHKPGTLYIKPQLLLLAVRVRLNMTMTDVLEHLTCVLGRQPQKFNLSLSDSVGPNLKLPIFYGGGICTGYIQWTADGKSSASSDRHYPMSILCLQKQSYNRRTGAPLSIKSFYWLI